MNFQFKHLVFALVISTAWMLFYACERPCQTTCNPGAECVKGECQCKEGTYYYFGECIELLPDTYLAITNDCYCYDTILFNIRKNQNDYTFQFRSIEQIFNNSTYIDDTYTLYYEMPDGDSLDVPFINQKCPYLDGSTLKFTRPRIGGKKQDDGSWKLTLRFPIKINDVTVIDSCTVIARKIN